MTVRKEYLQGLSIRELETLRTAVGQKSVERIKEELKRRQSEANPAPLSDDGSEDTPIIHRPGLIVLRRLPPSHNATYEPFIHRQGQHSGKAGIRLTEEAREWKKWARRQAAAQWNDDPMITPIDLTLLICLSGKRGRDNPNVEKLLWDTLEGICYLDDNQIRDRTVRHRHDEREGVVVEIRHRFPEEMPL